MSKKSGKIAELIAGCEGKGMDPHYLGYFECFNRRLFYEAHDVLEELWLAVRGGPNDLFYKGLIQLAGAYVHLQKNRLQPSASLFKLARKNLSLYPEPHERFSIKEALQLIEKWLEELESSEFMINPLRPDNAPILKLQFEA